MPPSWQNFPNSASLFESELMIRHDIARSTYVLHVTNLRHVWSESLDAKQIRLRAADLGTSIDPSEDAEQLTILLEKLKAAFEGCEGSVLHVMEGEDDQLRIKLFTPLPAGLAPLQWTLHLKRQPEEAVRNDVLRPLLGASYLQKIQIRHLTALLVEKDAAITRVLDKLESSNVDIHSIFPNIPKGKVKGRNSKKVTSREQLALRIPGLATFDLSAWADTSRSAAHAAATFRELVSGAFESGSAKPKYGTSMTDYSDIKPSQRPSEDKSASQRSENVDWDYESIHDTQSRREDAEPLQMLSPVTNDDEATDDDLDVQPSQIGGGNLSAVATKGASKPEEEMFAHQVSPARPAGRKLGTIGGRKDSTIGSPNPALSQSSQPVTLQSSRARTPTTQAGDQMSHMLATPPSRRRLGHIGGRNLTEDTLKLESQGSPSKSDRSISQMSPSRLIKAQVPAAELATSEAGVAEQAEESAQARADRKRDELKRQLEASSRVGSKKKRKF